MKVELISLKKDNIDIEGLDDLGLYSISSYLKSKNVSTNIDIMRESNLIYNSIINYKPDLIIISVYNIYPCVRDKFDNVDAIKILITYLKIKLPEATIALAGFPASNYWKEIMVTIKDISCVILGECEETAYELAISIENSIDLKNIKGIVYRNEMNELIMTNKREPIVDLDEIPLLINEGLYNKKTKIATMASSRGCKRNCSFCIVNDFWVKWRCRSIDSLMKEIDYLYKGFNIRRYNFIDESFEDSDNGIKRWREFAYLLKKTNIKISYYIQMRAETINQINNELIKELIDSGLCGISIGIETFNKNDRKIYGKYASIDVNVVSIKILKTKNIALAFNFINFNPYSSFESLKDNINWLTKLGYAFDITKICSYYQAQKGTRLYEKLKRDSLIIKSDKILDMYNYKYLDTKIESLTKFLKININDNKMYHKIHYYGHEFEFIIHHILNFGKKNIDILKAVQNYYNVVNKQFELLNLMFSKWFNEILFLAENLWDQEKALLLTNMYINDDEIIKIVNIIENHSFILLRNIQKNDRTILS